MPLKSNKEPNQWVPPHHYTVLDFSERDNLIFGRHARHIGRILDKHHFIQLIYNQQTEIAPSFQDFIHCHDGLDFVYPTSLPGSWNSPSCRFVILFYDSVEDVEEGQEQLSSILCQYDEDITLVNEEFGIQTFYADSETFVLTLTQG